MYTFIYIQIHMLEARVEELVKQLVKEFQYNKVLGRRIGDYMRKEVAEKEVEKKEAAEKEAEIELVPLEEDEVVSPPAVQADWGSSDNDDDEEDQEAWPSGSSDDEYNCDEGPIKFPKVKSWFKCPIYLREMYEHMNSVLFHIHSFIAEEIGPPDVVEQHRQLSRLLDAHKRDP
jgi:hypothetical protein